MKRIAFLLYAVLSFILTVAVVGSVSHLFPSPAEFITALAVSIPLGYLTVRISGFRQWPVAVLLLLLIYFGITGGLVAKHLIHTWTAAEAVDIEVSEADRYRRKALFSFTDARIDFERSGHYLLEHYGDHHYYAFPVLGADWQPGDEVLVWAWARTKKPCDMDCQKRLLPSALNYGIKVRMKAVKVNVRKAAEDAAQAHELILPEKLVLLDWGSGRTVKPYWRQLRNMLLIFTGIMAAVVVLQAAASGRRNGG